MGEAKVNVSVNTAALQGNYLAGIQNLLDVITFVYSGHSSVTEELYREHNIGFIAFHPASNRRLSYAEAKDQSTQWLLTSFLTDSVNVTGNFLNECRRVCALYRLAGKGRVTGEELKDVSERDWNRFDRLLFPQKFDCLRKEFDIETVYERHFLSLNMARNCLVHRKGFVGPKDVNEGGKLVITLHAVGLVAESPDGREKGVLDSPRPVEGGWRICLEAGKDSHHSFDVGQRIKLEEPELYQCVQTLYYLATDLVKAIESYGAAQGVGRAKS